MDTVEIARVESERGEIVLRERRDEGTPTVLELRVNGVFVMDTLETTSERALARAALALVDDPSDVLVGGLGLGFTMHEVLADPRVERCTVVELEQSLVDWMRDGTIAHGPRLLADERLTVTVNGVGTALTEAGSAAYDLVLLDVDNATLYTAPFLESARHVTRQALAISSADEAPRLEATMREVFDDVEAVRHAVRLGERDDHYWLYVARVASEG